MWKRLRGVHDDESGAAMVEYAIITAGIAVVAIAAVQSLGQAIIAVFGDIVSALSAV